MKPQYEDQVEQMEALYPTIYVVEPPEEALDCE